MMACPFDHSIGPVLPSAHAECRAFDFTVAFEDVAFTLVPNLMALLLVVCRIKHVFGKPKVVDWFQVRAIKAALFIILEAFQLVYIVFAADGSPLHTRFTIPSSVLVLVTGVALLILSPLDHVHSRRPSGIIQGYLFLTTLLDTSRLRTSWHILGVSRTASLQTAVIVTKFLLLLAESVSKASHIKDESSNPISPEDTAGFFSRSLLLWLNPLLLHGYRVKLSLNDLYPVGTSLQSSNLVSRLDVCWNKTSPAKKRRLALALLRAFMFDLLLIQVPRLALVGFAIAQPFLIEAALRFVRDKALEARLGQGLIGAFALTYVAIAISTAWYQHLTFRLLTRLRGALIGIIFKHGVRLPLSGNNSLTNATSLMSADIDRVTQTLQWVLNIFPNIVQVGLGLWILYIRIRAAIVAPVVVAIVCAMAAGMIGKRIPPRQRKWMQAIQHRVGITTEIIANIKSVKIAGLGSAVTKQIGDCRVSEIRDQKAFRKLQVTNIALGNTPAMLTPAVTFAAFAIAQSVGHSDQLTVVTAFTSLSLLSIMIDPIAELVTAFTNLTSALSSLDRIQEFLLKPVLEDSRQFQSSLKDNDGRDDEVLEAHVSSQRVEDNDIQLEEVSPTKLIHNQRAVLRLKNVTVSYIDEKPVLHDINMILPESNFTIVTGPVGSGKSTLLRSLLGEVRVLSGEIHSQTPRQIAYCDQTPWILNVSLRQNITRTSDYDSERYKRVIESCQLQDNFKQLPEGDQTLAGSKGLSLSGGQKARISLARAAYSGKQTILVDDTLSSLDSKTSWHCFHSLFAPGGLFRKTGMALVLATHNAAFLQYADKIIVLDNGGRISDQGDFNSLTKSSSYIQKLLETEQSAHTPTNAFASSTASGTSTTTTTTEKHATRKNTELTEGNENNSPKSHALSHYISSMGLTGIISFVSLVLLHIGCSTAQPIWLKFWTAANERNPNSSIGRWVGVYLLFSTATIAMIAIETGYFLLRLLPLSSLAIHRNLLAATMSAPLSYFVATDTGRIVNLFTSDLNLIDLSLPISFLLTSEKIVSVIAEIILTCIASGYLAISIPFVVIILYFLQRIYLATSRQLRILDLEQRAPLFENFIQTSSGLITLRAYSWTAAAERENAALIDASQRPYYLLFCLQRWLTLVLDLVTAGIATFLMGMAVALRNTIDPGFLGVALVSVMNFGQIVSALIVQLTNLETSLGAVQRIIDYGNAVPREDNIGGEKNVDTHDETAVKKSKEGWPTHGDILFENVSASYGTRTVLKNINLTLRSGTKTVICGRTGSGKSTLLGLILRLSELDEGSIIIDAVNIATLPSDFIRERIVGLPQDPLFLEDSVRRNLDPYAHHMGNDEPLLRALAKTGLAGLIEEKGGLDINLKTEWLSVGQQQLFCMARIMLRQGRVLLLDEATSHLDSFTRRTIDKLIQTEFAGWTVVMVTHHYELAVDSVLKVDQVITLHEGRIFEIRTES